MVPTPELFSHFPSEFSRNSADVIREKILDYYSNRTEFDSQFRMRAFSINGLEKEITKRLVESCERRQEQVNAASKNHSIQCVALNGVNCVSTRIERFVEENYIRHLEESQRHPLGGFDIYTFFGKYGSTPFGIHTDDEESILLHLGPAEKVFYIWAKKPDENQRYQDQLSNANKVVLRVGDRLHIPADIFHVAENPEWSVTLGVAPYHGLFDDWAAKYFKDKCEVRSGRQESSLNHAETVVEAGLHDLFETAKSELLLAARKLRSQRYFRFAPDFHNIPLPSNGIIRPNKYDIYLDERDGTVLMRGRVINVNPAWMETFRSVRKIIDALPDEGQSVAKILEVAQDAKTLHAGLQMAVSCNVLDLEH